MDMDDLIPTPSWLSDWGFSLAKEAPHGESKYRPVDCTRDLEQVRELLQDPTISASMLLSHPHLVFTPDARKYLEQLTQS